MFGFKKLLTRRRRPQPRRTSARLVLEPLEAREVLSAVPPSAVEQVFLERLNDARASPPAYGQSIGLDLSNVAPSQPLAFDTRLIGAARGHSQDMSVNNFFSHTGSNGSSPGQRMSAEGYPWRSWAESIAAGYSTPEEALKALIIDAGVPNLGHRVHLLAMNSNMQAMDQVGIGIVNGSGAYRNYYTIDTGYDSDSRPYLTGVVYNDLNSNSRYDAGEGLGGVTITVAGVGSVTTWSSGGYSFQVNPNASYSVTASGPGLSVPVTKSVSVGSVNARLNFNPVQAPPNPEAHIYVDGVEITSNTGSFNYGMTLTGVPVSKTFTVKNLGAQTLTLSNLSVPAGFTTTGFGSTSLTYGQSTTFTVRLAATTPGTFSGALSFSTSDPKRTTVSYTVSGTVGNVAVQDSGDAGFSTVGAWTRNTSEGYQGDMHHNSTPGGTGTRTASWSLSGLTAGIYRISATWTAYSNRATYSPFTVLNGSSTLGTVRFNQQTAPNDFTDQGVAWENMGQFSVVGGQLTVRLSDDAIGYVIADAIRVERVGDLPATTVTVQDNGDAGFSTVGAWTLNTREGYQGDIHHISSPGGTGSRTASWTFGGLTPGQYRVSATWTAYTNRATNSPFTVLDGSTALGTVRFNQQLAPNDLSDQGVAWEDLGVFSIATNAATVRLSDDANGYVIADAIRIERIGDLPAAAATIKDNGDTGFSTVGAWTRNTSEGYQGDMHHSSTPGGTGSRTATWSFSGLTPGQYRVSATWTAYTNRATNSPFTVLDGSTALGTVRLNQQLRPSDFSDAGVGWKDLGTFTVTGSQLSVQLSDDANAYVIADAIRIERLSS